MVQRGTDPAAGGPPSSFSTPPGNRRRSGGPRGAGEVRSGLERAQPGFVGRAPWRRIPPAYWRGALRDHDVVQRLGVRPRRTRHRTMFRPSQPHRSFVRADRHHSPCDRPARALVPGRAAVRVGRAFGAASASQETTSTSADRARPQSTPVRMRDRGSQGCARGSRCPSDGRSDGTGQAGASTAIFRARTPRIPTPAARRRRWRVTAAALADPALGGRGPATAAEGRRRTTS
jgi:hypothetical protein